MTEDNVMEFCQWLVSEKGIEAGNLSDYINNNEEEVLKLAQEFKKPKFKVGGKVEAAAEKFKCGGKTEEKQDGGKMSRNDFKGLKSSRRNVRKAAMDNYGYTREQFYNAYENAKATYANRGLGRRAAKIAAQELLMKPIGVDAGEKYDSVIKSPEQISIRQTAITGTPAGYTPMTVGDGLDALSFDKAFAAGRTTAINGGPKTFNWRGKVYGTDLAEPKSTTGLVDIPIVTRKPFNTSVNIDMPSFDDFNPEIAPEIKTSPIKTKQEVLDMVTVTPRSNIKGTSNTNRTVDSVAVGDIPVYANKISSKVNVPVTRPMNRFLAGYQDGGKAIKTPSGFIYETENGYVDSDGKKTYFDEGALARRSAYKKGLEMFRKDVVKHDIPDGDIYKMTTFYPMSNDTIITRIMPNGNLDVEKNGIKTGISRILGLENDFDKYSKIFKKK